MYGCGSEKKLESSKIRGRSSVRFFFVSRVGVGRDSTLTGLTPRPISGETQHPRDTAKHNSFIRGTPLHVLNGTQYPRGTTRRDSSMAGSREMFCGGFSNDGTPQNGIEYSRDFTGCFAPDPATIEYDSSVFLFLVDPRYFFGWAKAVPGGVRKTQSVYNTHPHDKTKQRSDCGGDAASYVPMCTEQHLVLKRVTRVQNNRTTYSDLNPERARLVHP